MLGRIAALIFGILALFGLFDKSTGDVFTYNVLIAAGLCLLALHLSGGPTGWRRRR